MISISQIMRSGLYKYTYHMEWMIIIMITTNGVLSFVTSPWACWDDNITVLTICRRKVQSIELGAFMDADS